MSDDMWVYALPVLPLLVTWVWHLFTNEKKGCESQYCGAGINRRRRARS
jgi:hypothetical protein